MGEVNLRQPRRDLHHCSLAGTSLIYNVVIRSHASKLVLCCVYLALLELWQFQSRLTLNAVSRSLFLRNILLLIWPKLTNASGLFSFSIRPRARSVHSNSRLNKSDVSTVTTYRDSRILLVSSVGVTTITAFRWSTPSPVIIFNWDERSFIPVHRSFMD